MRVVTVVTGLPPSAAGVRGVWAVPCGCCSDPPSGMGAGAPRPHAWRRQCGLGGASPRASAALSPQPPSWAALCPPLARTHTWPRLAGRAGQDPQERPGQKPAVRASAGGGRPGGHSTWGRGVGRVRSRHPVEAICPRSLLRAHRSRPDPARSCSKDECGLGAGVSPSPRHWQAQPRPQSLAPVDTQCPSPRPPSTSKHPGPVHVRSPYGTPEAPLGGHGLSHEPRNSPNRPREPTGPGCPAANHDLAR